MIKGTTICAVKRDGVCAIAGDGQVTLGESTIMKNGAKKVRRIYNGSVVIGFAGSVADAFALSERFEEYLTQFSGNLPRAAVELAQDWRTDRAMRKLEAMLLCADSDNLMLISGTGEVIEPLGIKFLMDKKVSRLSGGELQRVAITMCLSMIIF